ncbi:hypothetical protein C8Q78DRAFT_744892 [Trametes maxima]|nr:hypothetical protein C8Q78DRAFT_744892 [Trametes maxima]
MCKTSHRSVPQCQHVQRPRKAVVLCGASPSMQGTISGMVCEVLIPHHNSNSSVHTFCDPPFPGSSLATAPITYTKYSQRPSYSIVSRQLRRTYSKTSPSARLCILEASEVHPALSDPALSFAVIDCAHCPVAVLGCPK